jgi:hypothetical protein
LFDHIHEQEQIGIHPPDGAAEMDIFPILHNIAI